MCQFRSGIILKNRCVVAQGANDSHSDLLKELNIEDTTENAMRRFVRVELLPPNREWWIDPDLWDINVDQDILPDWYLSDPERYNEEFRAAVKEWWIRHVLIDQKVEELSGGYYRLKRCEVRRLLNDVQVMLDNSTVQDMRGNSTVQRMWNNSTVQRMRDNSTVQDMWDNSTVQDMWDNSTVQDMWNNSTVQDMRDNSTVQDMWNNSTVQDMRDNSTVQDMWDNSTVQDMRGNSTVQDMWNNSTVQDMRGNSTVQDMWDNSLAKDYAKGIVHISKDMTLEVQVHKNIDE